MPMKKILVITGIRSEYFILRPVLLALQSSKQFKIKLAVSGAHLSSWHGNTLEMIKKDGLPIADKIDSLFMTNRETQRPKGIAALLYGLSQCVERENPDFLLVLGDREEAIATALVGNYMNVLTAHIAGGDPVYGNADDPVRFAVSKLAHIHFTIAKQHSENLKKIGEEPFRIFWTGNPAIDSIRKVKNMEWDKVQKHLNWGIKKKNYIVLIKHPLSSEKEEVYSQMKITISAITSFAQRNRLKIIGIYPNTDPGSYDILKAIEEANAPEIIRFYKTLPHEIFVNIMRNALALTGNSSMGILEAPFYCLPVVNIGKRQGGRISAGNVIFVEHNEKQITRALKRACFDQGFRQQIKKARNFYGDGRASERIINALSSIDPKDKKWLVKRKLV